MNTIYRKFWLVVGILLVLQLAACEPIVVSQQGSQGQANTPTSKTSGGGPTTQEQQLAQYVFSLINHDRVAIGLAAYSWNAALARGARLHNMRMVGFGQLSHQCPGEPDLGTRVTNDGLVWREVGENIG